MGKDIAVVYFEHESIYTVTAVKQFETNSLRAAENWIKKHSDSPFLGIVHNFEGDEINANYVQEIYID